jgi:hypothetical protein
VRVLSARIVGRKDNHVDEHTRECLGGLVERSITSDTLIGELDRLAAHRGYPGVLRCDNGPELACAVLADWAGARVGLFSYRRVNRGETDMSNSSTAESAMNASTSTSSGHWPRPASSLAAGSANITGSGPTPRLAISLPRITRPAAPTASR